MENPISLVLFIIGTITVSMTLLKRKKPKEPDIDDSVLYAHDIPMGGHSIKDPCNNVTITITVGDCYGEYYFSVSGDGMRINGATPENERGRLNDGDIIQVGEKEIEFRA